MDSVTASSVGPSQGPASKLTSRQRQVADLVMRGLSNRDIGSALCISEETVKRHLYNIYAKLDVKNRVQLLRKLTDL